MNQKCLKAISINVHGMRDRAKRQRVLLWLVSFSFDIIFLQETHICNQADQNAFLEDWEGQAHFSFGSSHSCGVGILLRKDFPGTLSYKTSDLEGRWLNLVLDLGYSSLQLLNVYAPNTISDRADFFNSLISVVKGHLPSIVGGDFNCIEDLYLDKEGGDRQLGVSDLNSLRKLKRLFGLVDIFRGQHPSDRTFTWSNNCVHCRLDKFFLSNDISKCCSKSKIICYPFSDHDAPCIYFSLPDAPKKGPGTWKFNCSLLNNESFVEKVETLIKHWQGRKSDFSGKLDVWWDFLKRKIKHLSIKFSKKLAKSRRQERNRLQAKIQLLRSTDPSNAELTDALKELETHDNFLLSGARLRAKEFHYSYYEKSSSYFFSLEHSRQAKKVISSMKREDGSKATTSEDILAHISDFYSSLYSAESANDSEQKFLLDSVTRFLPKDAQNTLEGPLTKDECLTALRLMQAGKSPGSDGLPAEFYLHFWTCIADDFMDVIEFCLARGRLTDSMSGAILSLLFKKGDKEDIKNWRPISLLNTDYKIASKALSLRLRGVLQHIMHPDQSCSVPGRSINDNLILIRDCLVYIGQKNLSLAVLKIDQEKAFDRVDWRFLSLLLSKMNFGPRFQSFISSLYCSAYCRATNNGHLSEKIFLTRGVRQGCPLSPLLFSITAEVLGNIVRQNNDIIGLHLPGCSEQLKITQYADDTTIFVRTEASVDSTLETLSIYEKGSGAKVNYSVGKSQGRWFNHNQVITRHSSPLSWTDQDMEILGLTFGSPEAEHQSWEKRLCKLRNRLEAWSSRSLSLKGKIMIVNCVALAGLVYVGSIFDPPRDILKEINRVIFSFLWSNKNELVSRCTLYQPVAKGGLGLTNIASKCLALKLNFLKKLVDQTYLNKCIFLPRYYIGRAFVKYCPTASFLKANSRPHSLHRPPLYDRLLQNISENSNNVASFAANTSTVRNIYAVLLSKQYSCPKAQTKWVHDLTLSNISWPKIWCTARNGLSTGPESDTSWKIVHRVLKTSSYLRSWGLNIPINCDLCPLVETMDHVFLQCAPAKTVWKGFTTLITSIVGSFSLCPSFVYLHRFPKCNDKFKSLLCAYTLKLIKYNIWLSRCKRKFEGRRTDPTVIIHQIKAEIRSRVTLSKQSTGILQQEFKIWSYKDILCKEQDETLIFNI